MTLLKLFGHTLLATGLMAVAFSPAFSQVGADHPAVPELQKPEFLPAKPEVPFALPPVPLPMLAAPQDKTETRIELKRVIFQGNTVISTAELEKLCADYVGRTVSVADLELLRQNLSRHYIDLGYLNSGVLFTQSAYADGALTF